MSADVVDMAARRRAGRRPGAPGQVDVELESTPGEVCLALMVGSEGMEAFFDPDAADRLADDLKRHAAAARAAAVGRLACAPSSHLTTKERR
jgi:hypothetical protein